jgi:hypothetical protein
MQTRAKASIGAAVLGLGLLLTPAAGAAGRTTEKPRAERAFTGLLRWVESVMDKVTKTEGACTAGEVAGGIDPLGCPRTSGAQRSTTGDVAEAIDPNG